MTKQINPNCPCKNDCERHGICEECQEHHKNDATTCQRIKKKEAEQGR